MRYEAAVDVNLRQPRGNPRRAGGTCSPTSGSTTWMRNAYSFQRAEADVQQYISLLSEPARARAAGAGVRVRRRRGRASPVLLPAVAWRAGRPPRLSSPPLPRQARAAAAGGVPLGDLHGRGRRAVLRHRQGRVARRGSEPARIWNRTTASASGSAPRTASSSASKPRSAAAAASTSSSGSTMFSRAVSASSSRRHAGLLVVAVVAGWSVVASRAATSAVLP